LYYYSCPKCGTAYYSSASPETIKPWECDVCRHTIVHPAAGEKKASEKHRKAPRIPTGKSAGMGGMNLPGVGS
jgi:ribosomal protein S27E